MSNDDFLQTFGGMPVVTVNADPPPDDPAAVAWRIDMDYGDDQEPALERVLELAGPGGPRALIFGEWDEMHSYHFPWELLIGNAGRLEALRHLFIGEVSREQCEISWIQPGDVTPLLEAFPALESLWLRGGEELDLKPVRHEGLRALVLQSGGLPGRVVRAVAASDLPHLELLDLWLGVDNYGGDATVEDLAPILSGRTLPALKHLALSNSEIADEIAAAVAAAPVVAQLDHLDLSWGVLGDAGAESLLAGQPLTHLKSLDLNHHFMSPEMMRRLIDELPATLVDVSDRQQDAKWGRYTAVSE